MADSHDAPPIARAGARPDDIAPDGSEIRLIADERQGATKASLCEVRLGPGGASQAVHRTVEEIWFVVAGEGWVWRCPPGVAASTYPPARVRAGDSLVIPVGWSFQFKAGESDELRFLCYTSPPWPGHQEAVSVERGAFDR